MLSQLQFRMVFVGTVLLFGWVSYLAAVTANDVYDLRERESLARGLIVAESLANSIGRAVGYGIELDDLNGIESVFVARIEDNQDIIEIVLDDLDGNARIPLTTPKRQGVSVSAVVKAANESIGQVTVYLRDTSIFGSVSFPIAVALLLLLVVVVVSREAVNYSVRRGPGLREEAAKDLVAQIAELNFNSVVREAHLKRLDLRAAWLSTQIRDLNERSTRLFRLIVSLRRTEPRSAEQARLMALAKEAKGDAKFAVAKPYLKRLSPMAIDIRWLVFVATTSLSVNLFMVHRLNNNLFFSGPFMIGLGLLAALSGYELAQLWLRSQSAQVVCLGGLVILGGVPLVFVVMTFLGSGSMPASVQALLVTNAGMRDLAQVAVGCMQGIGLGIFFSGLKSFVATSDLPLWGYEGLPIVVLTALALVGASLAMIWGVFLGGSGMMLVSVALAVVTYFFFTISAFAGWNSTNRVTPHFALSDGNGLTGVSVGFVLGTILSAAASGVFPAGRIETAQLFAWSLIAICFGFLAQMHKPRLTEYLSGIFALIAAAVIFSGFLSSSFAGIAVSIVALGIVTYYMICVLVEIGRETRDTPLTRTMRSLVIGATTASLFYAVCIYFALQAAIPWGFVIVGCLIIVVARKKKAAKMAHAA